MQKLSFVIPCYRSEKTVRSVYEEIVSVVGQREDYCYEVVAVNDCSPDDVLKVLVGIAEEDKNFKVIDFAKNMGKHAALMAGFRHVTGDIVICVDDDFQCPVDQLWRLLEPLDHGYDIAMAQYGKKAQSSFKNFGSKCNDLMMTWMIGKPKDFQFANFAAIRRFIIDEIIRYENPYSYINGLILRTTNNYVNVPMKERERLSGSSGYTFFKSLKLWINGLTAFSIRPIRIADYLGCLFAFLGFVIGLVEIVFALMPSQQSGIAASVIAAVFFVGGLIMLLLGLLGEYVGRIYMCINNSPQYVIRRTWNVPQRRDG